MKIAVSTQDGKTICGHLGMCNQFIIFEADEYGIKTRELRENAGLCNKHEAEVEKKHNVNMLQDCHAVITQGMGRGMYEGLYNAGIIPVITMESHPESAVKQFISCGIPTAYKGNCSCGAISPSMKDNEVPKAIALIKKAVKAWRTPAVTVVAAGGDPYKVLVSCILSLRTQDRTTADASARLFALAGNPKAMLGLSKETIEKAIYPVGFYRNKAAAILGISAMLLEKYGGRVPDEIDELLKLPGVGRKTANLVVTVGYGKPGICVDTHVHRITNRWGYVKTKAPGDTERALRAKLPRRYWIEINDLLVTFGQNQCKPISPICSTCPVHRYCDRVGVGKQR